VAFADLALLLLLLGTAPGASAQSAEDPESVVNAYSAALNGHDMPAALALFDQNGSATDLRGRHFEGRSGLTEFLLANGFGTANARVRTNGLQVIGNRAVWTYACSCAATATDVRVVLNHNKIVVFFMVPPGVAPTAAAPASGPSAALWLAGLSLVAAVLLLVRGAFTASQPAPPRPAQGRLMAELARAHGVRVDPA